MIHSSYFVAACNPSVGVFACCSDVMLQTFAPRELHSCCIEGNIVECKNTDCSFLVLFILLMLSQNHFLFLLCFVFVFFAPCFTGTQMVGRLLCTIVTPPHHRPLSDTRPSVSHPFCGASQSSFSLPNPPLVLTRMGLNDNSPFILFWNT